jgi:hypothetical protein
MNLSWGDRENICFLCGKHTEDFTVEKIKTTVVSMNSEIPESHQTCLVEMRVYCCAKHGMK